MVTVLHGLTDRYVTGKSTQLRHNCTQVHRQNLLWRQLQTQTATVHHHQTHAAFYVDNTCKNTYQPPLLPMDCTTGCIRQSTCCTRKQALTEINQHVIIADLLWLQQYVNKKLAKFRDCHKVPVESIHIFRNIQIPLKTMLRENYVPKNQFSHFDTILACVKHTDNGSQHTHVVDVCCIWGIMVKMVKTINYTDITHHNGCFIQRVY